MPFRLALEYAGTGFWSGDEVEEWLLPPPHPVKMKTNGTKKAKKRTISLRMVHLRVDVVLITAYLWRGYCVHRPQVLRAFALPYAEVLRTQTAKLKN